MIEKRAKAPLVPPKAFTKPLRVVNAIVLLFSAAIFPMWYMGSLYLQQVLALSPLTTGLVFLPMALVIFACASQAGKLVGRAGVRTVLGCGLLAMTAGMALFARIGDGGSAIQYIMVPGILTAIGIGFSIVPSTIAATQSAAQGQAGLASGLVNTSRQVGGGLGLAVLISIATLFTSHLVGRGHPVPQALTDGFRLGYLIGAGLVAVAAVLTFLLVPAPRAEAQHRAGTPRGVGGGRRDRAVRGGRVRRAALARGADRGSTRPTAPTRTCPRPACTRPRCSSRPRPRARRRSPATSWSPTSTT